MKRTFSVFASLVLASIFCFQTVNACSLKIPPLRKKFREAKSVFLGKVVKIVDYSPSEAEKSAIPEYWQDYKYFSKVRFEIKNKWKGDVSENQEFLAVADWECGCPGDAPERFKEGEEFIIFASGKKFIIVCDAGRTKIEGKEQLIKKLDEFWFRAWARIYPF
jgi:hypothetical protein